MAAMLMRAFTTALTSPRRRAANRSLLVIRRKLTASAPTVRYFHDPADPYSHLTVQMLPPLESRYRIKIIPYLVPPPDASAAPDSGRLSQWSLRDAATLAQRYHLQFPQDPPPADPAHLTELSAVLTNALDAPDFAHVAVQAGNLFWSRRGNEAARLATANDVTVQQRLAEGDHERRRLGHYLGATFHFEGEWYWGLDRLHYLEERLTAQGLDTNPAAPPLAPKREITLAGPPCQNPGHALHFFLSLRSPYTCIAVRRARALAQHYGVELRLRFVLPMVMRGLPVPRAKRFYIMLDTKREAERLGIPFGTVVDPVGSGVERGLAVLHHAIAIGQGPEFCESFLTGVFAEGIDANTNSGLHRIAERAGITPLAVAAALADPAWRTEAEDNRQEMLAAGLWGVPSFRVDEGPMVWGQDRLWMIEDALIQLPNINRAAIGR